MSALSSPRLRRLASSPGAAAPDGEHCDMCGEQVPSEHRHLLDLESREVRCACRACAVLFDHRAAGGGHYRLIPDTCVRLDEFELDDVTWEELRIPVDMAYFFRRDGRVQAFYPSPMGATESLLGLDAWSALEQVNPALRQMQPDVEALLVNRSRGARQHFLVSIDECYRLVAVIRTGWRGFTGGKEVWEEIGLFFGDLERRATTSERS